MLCLTLCVSKLNLFVSIGTSLGHCTVRCDFFFPNLSFEIRGVAYLRVRLKHECLRYFEIILDFLCAAILDVVTFYGYHYYLYHPLGKPVNKRTIV